MPWEGVTVSEQRQNFIRHYLSGIYSHSELAKAFCISRKTAYKWIKRFNDEGRGGLEERSRRPHSCPWQTEAEIVQEIVRLREARPRMGPKKLIVSLKKHHRGKELPAISTVAHILSREGLAKKPPRHRRANPGCPKSVATGPNDIWAADYKGQFRVSLDSSLRTQQARFDSFRHEFNTDRPHEALQMACPAEVYRRSKVQMPSGDAGCEYPGHFVVRRVSRCGTIRVFRNQIFVTQVPNGESVGLEEVDDGIYDLYFCFYLIGRYDLRTIGSHDIISKVPTAVRSADRPKGCHPCP